MKHPKVISTVKEKKILPDAVSDLEQTDLTKTTGKILWHGLT